LQRAREAVANFVSHAEQCRYSVGVLRYFRKIMPVTAVPFNPMTSPLPLSSQAYPIVVGRYALFEPIASGGMASVHIGRLSGSFGFARTVAIKRLHQNLALDPEFIAMFLDEARLAARIRHTNVVQTLDVVNLDNELLLVMEYVSGASLSRIQVRERQAGRVAPHRVAVDIMVGALNGLHAAHEATNENGEPLGIVHRDVSPQNILIGTDGVARLLDFGIAKAIGGVHYTRPNQVKGKLRYLSPEGITAQTVTRASDIYAASVVLWELLTGRRLFDGENDGQVMNQVLNSALMPPSSERTHISRKLDEIVMCGLSRDPAARFATAREMASALEAAVIPVNRSAVAEWAMSSVGDEIAERDRCVAGIEREMQAEGTPAGQGLSPASLSLGSRSVEGRSAGESGSAPSLSLEHSIIAREVAPRRRLSAVVLAVALTGCLLLAGLWARSKPSAHELPQATSAPVVTTIAMLNPSAPRPTATEPVVAVAPALVVAVPEVPQTTRASNTSAPTASAPRKPRRITSPIAPGKTAAVDRIYRRD
jgi:eukaryotic-like serine/threonine-protein kinase